LNMNYVDFSVNSVFGIFQGARRRPRKYFTNQLMLEAMLLTQVYPVYDEREFNNNDTRVRLRASNTPSWSLFCLA